MRFVAQIDSFEMNRKGNPISKKTGEAHFVFGDAGMIYVWFCFHCLTPLATLEQN